MPRNPQPKRIRQKPRVVGKSVANEKMNPQLQNNGPTRLRRQGTQVRGRGSAPGTIQPRRINRVLR